VKSVQAIRAIFDGQEIKPIEPIMTRKRTEVLVIFPNSENKFSPQEARKTLKGLGRGERLTEKLLKLRSQDIKLEKRQ
jgi:hypothetical protein